MNKMVRLLVACVAMLAAFASWGFSLTMHPYEYEGKNGAGLGCIKATAGMKLEPGKWYTNFSVVKAYCEKNGIPMFALWSNATCIHCWYTDIVFIQDSFKEWAKTHDAGQVIYCFMAGGEQGEPDQKGSEAYNWMWHNRSLKAFPFTAFYWKKNGAVKAEVHLTGDDLCKGSAPNALNFGDATIPLRVQNVTKKFEEVFKDWHPAPDYVGGSFKTVESADNRLEVEAGTKSVSVDLVRDAEAAAHATNAVIAVQNAAGQQLATVPVAWKANEKAKTVEIELPAGALAKDGDQLTLILKDIGGTVGGTNHITYVELENSAANPLWIGERTAGGATTQAALPQAATVPELAWGEWTMDLDVAKQKVAAAKGKAYTLVLVAGTLWCPDCANVEKVFTGLSDGRGENKFKAWANSKQIALVTIDVPRFETNTVASVKPTLLSREARENKSGLGYLTRKSVTDADAAQVLARNRTLVSTNTDKGGFHRPEDPNPYRIGVPTFVLLRKDGTVAARLTRFAAMGASATAANFDNYLKRFEEMIQLAETDATEVENNAAGAGAISFKANGGSAEGQLSTADLQDTFKLDGVGGNALQKVTVKGATDAEVAVSFVKLTDGVAETVGKPAYGKLSAGVSLENTFTEAGDFYVEVKARDAAAAPYDIASAKDGNYHAFTITGNVVLIPGEQRATGNAPETADTVTMRLEKDQLYRLDGVAAADVAAIFAPVDAGHPACKFFTALVGGDQAVKVAAGNGGSLTYQKWVPGEIAFATTTAEAKEGATPDVITIKVVRQNGASGRVTARVAVDARKTDLYDINSNPRFAFADRELVWDDGDATSRTLEVKVLNNADYDGNGQVVLSLAIFADENGDTVVPAASAAFTLSVTEDEQQAPGRAAIVGVEPVYGKPLTVYARATEGATLKVARIEARDGDVAATLKSALAGVKIAGDGYDAATQQIAWKNRDDATKAITVTGIPVGKSAKLTLGALNGFRVLNGSNTVTVVSVADDAPAFETASDALTLYRYVATSNVYPLASTKGGKVALTKLAGTLPAGLKVTYDAAANALVLAGVPTKAGTFTLTYQASERRGTATVAGLVKELVLKIVDTTSVKAEPEAANAAVGASRTFKNLAVIDPDNQCLAGTLQVTIPATGKASAKFTCSDGSVALSAKSWTAFDPATKAFTTELTAKNGYAMTLVANTDGSVVAELQNPHVDRAYTAETDGTVWSRTNPASAWEGYYTVALPVRKDEIEEDTANLAPRGTGYLTLKMDTASAYNAGTVTWAGLLPNGTKISGKTVLLKGEKYARLPIFKKSTTDEFSALCEIAAHAKTKAERRSVRAPDNVVPYWAHAERVAAAKANYAVTLDVFGGIYDKTEDLVTCCDDDYSKTDFNLVFDTSALGTMFGETAGRVAAGPLTVLEDTMKLVGAPTGMTLTLTRATGVVTGTVRIPYGEAGKYVTAKYAGVVLTGWGDGCGCLPDDVPVRPLLNGSFYFTDKVPYTTATGAARTQNVVRAGDVKAE